MGGSRVGIQAHIEGLVGRFYKIFYDVYKKKDHASSVVVSVSRPY